MVANNQTALIELLELAKDHQARPAWCTTEDFLKEGEKIIFNKISSRGVAMFNDGLKNGGYLNILLHVLQAVSGSDEATLRLIIDLDVETKPIIKKVDELRTSE